MIRWVTMRKTRIAPGEHYHIYNRGNDKQLIFLDDRDRARFVFAILYFQLPTAFYNLGRKVTHFVRHRVFNIQELDNEAMARRYIDLVAFALMPNHFHLIVHETKEGGISRYMQRVLDAYTKYFNTKYKKSGHLFQGPFQAVHIEDNEQLLYLSAYIHRNPREIRGWKNKEHEFEWSSYQDYIKKNRWGSLLNTEVISSQFSNDEYVDFVDTSSAKLNDVLDTRCLTDKYAGITRS